MGVDPQLLPFLEAALNAPVGDITPEQARRNFEMLARSWPKPPVGLVSDLRLTTRPALPARYYRAPAPALAGLIVFFHGGGWVVGSLDTHDGLCRELCRRSSINVLSVEYRLAPEHKFPAAVEDAFAAIVWASENLGLLNAEMPLIVAGDSAGATIAAAACVIARDLAGPQIAGQLLLYPATDLRMNSRSFDEFSDGYLLTKAAIEWYVEHYGPPPFDDVRASPLLNPHLDNLPATLLVTAEFDPLRDEAEAFGRRLALAGVPTNVKRYSGMIHGFAALPGLDTADEALDGCAAWLKQLVNSAGGET